VSEKQRRPPRDPQQRRRNLKVLALLGTILVTMSVLVGYSETLYRLFCAATGYNGTTQRVAATDGKISSRVVTVRFSTSVAPGLPWRFEPAQRAVTLHLGQDTLAFFNATNLSDKDTVGHATFNVTPTKVGLYFKKIQCFCFTEEKLGAHQSAEMPVDFFVDPRLGTDPDTQDVDTITLSYQFFSSKQPDGATDLARFATQPNAVDGEKIFASRCAGCHAMDKTVVGPPLDGVFGRKAAALPGYPYSPALEKAAIVWNAASLDKWLAGAQQDVPGALMPVSISDARTRADIIAYLQSESGPKRTAAAATAAP
jgi:cytochrome c oxidase assembly protein subunit 11